MAGLKVNFDWLKVPCLMLWRVMQNGMLSSMAPLGTTDISYHLLPEYSGDVVLVHVHK